MVAKTTKLGEEGKLSAFHRIAERKRAENAICKSEPPPKDDLYFRDDSGRDYVTTDSLERFQEKENREKAISEHGNDKNKRLDLCGFPVRDREFMFNYDYKAVLNNFKGLDIKNANWIFIYGSPGTGKTTMAMRLIWEWMKLEPARKSTFLSVRDWIEQQYQKFGNDAANGIPELPRFRKYVILDDFDKIYFTEWQILQVFRLIDFLNRSDKKVIITSNHGLSDLLKKSKYDLNVKSTVDRIAGRAKSAILAMDGKSMRNPNFELK